MLTLITPPASLAHDLSFDVKEHLGLEIDPVPADSNHIARLTEAAVAALDGPAGRLCRCLYTQTWRQTIDYGFPPVVELTLPPITAITAIRYTDEDGIEHTLDSSAYRATGLGAWLTEITPAYGQAWPVVRHEREAIEIDFVTGYGTDPDAVPPAIIQAIRLTVAHWYFHRSAVESSGLAEVPMSARALLAPFRVYRCPAP